MQVTETLNSGLKREITVTIPASDLEARLATRLENARGKVRINGFRPGKVPLAHLRKVYGKSFMAEVVNEILTDSPRSIVADRGEKAAMQPEVTMTEDQSEAEKILAGGADFEFKLAYEVIPPIEIKDVSKIAVNRPVYDVPEDEIDEQVKRVAESSRTYEPKDGPAAKGDRVTIDFVGKMDGTAFEGGSGTGQPLVIGSGEFIPGFEDQLVGATAGESRTVAVTFPPSYSAPNLAGKDATFDVTVTEVAAPGSLEISDETAKSLGLESLERLREVVKGQIESQYGSMTRQKVKRQLLDQLDAEYAFEAPSRLVDAEFDNIWNQVNRDLQAAGRTFADEETSEDEAKAEYRRLAERRVRLGLVLAEIGSQAGVQVSDEEVQRELFAQIRRFPADQQQNVFDFYRNNPNALTSIRAPIFEEKVVDHLLGQVAVTDQKVSKEELLAEDDASDAKPVKKTKPPKGAAAEGAEGDEPKRKAPAKKKAAAKDAE